MKSTSKTRKLVVFILYIVFLFWIIVLNGQFSLKQTYLLAEMNPISDESSIFNSLANILFFFPLGYIIRWMNLETRRYSDIVILTLLCLLLAIFRYTFRAGRFDIADIIIGIAGGLIGFYVYWLNYEENTGNDSLEKQKV